MSDEDTEPVQPMEGEEEPDNSQGPEPEAEAHEPDAEVHMNEVKCMPAGPAIACRAVDMPRCNACTPDPASCPSTGA